VFHLFLPFVRGADIIHSVCVIVVQWSGVWCMLCWRELVFIVLAVLSLYSPLVKSQFAFSIQSSIVVLAT
jgi:hypothetical protein